MMNKFLYWAWSVLALAGSSASIQLRLGNTASKAKLPKPLSDVTASVGPDGLIYVAGGCDSAFGSQWNDEVGSFRCNSVSSSFYAFDPQTEQFMVLPDMPEPRYRHAAVAINNQIWLVGGRDEFDNVIGNVDVYDIDSGIWQTFSDLHDTYWVSDLGGFSARGRAFFLGGFSQDYRALRRAFSIDPVSSLSNGRLDIVRHANLVHRRGDIGVTVNENETLAYVSGGSSHTNGFCSPLSSVEQYDLINNEFEEMPPLVQARTGKTVFELQNTLVALGGAQHVQKLCNKTAGDPSEMQTPVYEVEMYDQGKWDVVDKLAGDYRFRSTSAVYNDAVYSFGGQSVYFSVCMCHPCVDDVVIYRQRYTPETEAPFTTEYSLGYQSTNSETGDDDMSYWGGTGGNEDMAYEGGTDGGAGLAYGGGTDQLDEQSNPTDQTQFAPPEGEEKSDEAPTTSEETKGTGFGIYNRDGFTMASSASSASSTSSATQCFTLNFLFTVTMGVLSTFLM